MTLSATIPTLNVVTDGVLIIFLGRILLTECRLIIIVEVLESYTV